MADIHIENIVVSTHIAKALNLGELSNTISDSKYAVEEFPGLRLHFEKPKTAVLLFSDGKVICTGAKTMEEVDDSIHMTRDKLNDVGVKVFKKPKIVVQNMVASLDLKKNLDLNSIAQSMWLENVKYEPKRFPGIVYKMDNPNAVILIFGSGKIVCTGIKLEEISAAIGKTTDKLFSVGM